MATKKLSRASERAVAIHAETHIRLALSVADQYRSWPPTKKWQREYAAAMTAALRAGKVLRRRLLLLERK